MTHSTQPLQFPAADDAGVLIFEYRNAHVSEMREWVRAAIADLESPPPTTQHAIIVAEYLAHLELGRGLYRAESQLLGEAVRDVLTVWLLAHVENEDERRRRAEWLDDQQNGRAIA